MAFYEGKVNKNALIDEIMAKLTTAPAGSPSPYWTKVSTGTYENEGYILHSKGSSGKDDIFIMIRQNRGNGLTFQIIEDYEPNNVEGINGVKTNASQDAILLFYNESDNSYPDFAPITYWLSFDKDKIMLTLAADRLYAGWRKSFGFFGLPERLSDEEDSTAVMIAISQYGHGLTGTNYANGQYGNYGRCTLLKSRKLLNQTVYAMRTLSRFKSKGWNDAILLGEIYLEPYSTEYPEGFRAKIPCVKPLIPDGSLLEYRDGDEITVGTRRYTIHRITRHNNNAENYNQNCFTTDWIAVEQLT